jgi:hypothetical protein
MSVGEASAALMQGAYCRCGETGRGQMWLRGTMVGKVGPRIMRLMQEDPLCEECLTFPAAKAGGFLPPGGDRS